MLDFKLTGRTVLVTGGSRGIGKAVALASAEAGANIALGSRNLQACKVVRNLCIEKGAKAEAFELDVLNIQSIKTFFKKSEKKFKTIDVLVNNVGLTIVKPAIELGEMEFDEVCNTNFKSTYFASVEAARRMIHQEKGGVIINISSQVGHVGGPLRAAYSGTKGAVNSLTQSLAAEWAPYGVRVSGVSPTFTRTEMMIQGANNPEFKKNFEKIPLGRPAEPIDIAAAVIYLASDAGKFVTGETILVDGGYTAI